MTPRRHIHMVFLLLVVILAGCGGKTNLAKLSSRELFELGMEKYKKKKYLEAIEALQATIFNYPGESQIDTAQYYLALSYFGNEDYVLGQVEFNRLLTNYPASPFAPQAQLMKAVCFFKGTPNHYGLDQTDLQTAITQFEDFILDYPESEAVPEANHYLKEARTRLAHKYYESGIVYIRLSDYTAARTYFQKVIDEYTNTEYAADATYQIAETYYRQRNWDKANELFSNFGTIWPEHRWAADAAERACEAAFQGGEEALRAGESTVARRRFERFRTACGQDTDRLKKVEEYLQMIGNLPVVEVDSTDAGS
ncbi:MAG: outer membrane protein assembly factor BamD [Candidatus Zixiibacteriota bacterium]